MNLDSETLIDIESLIGFLEKPIEPDKKEIWQAGLRKLALRYARPLLNEVYESRANPNPSTMKKMSLAISALTEFIRDRSAMRSSLCPGCKAEVKWPVMSSDPDELFAMSSRVMEEYHSGNKVSGAAVGGRRVVAGQPAKKEAGGVHQSAGGQVETAPAVPRRRGRPRKVDLVRPSTGNGTV